MPPFLRSPATNTTFLPFGALGPVVGPSHLSARAVAALAALVAMSVYSSARSAEVVASAHTPASRADVQSFIKFPPAIIQGLAAGA